MSGTLSPWPVVQNGNQGHRIRAIQFLLRAHGPVSLSTVPPNELTLEDRALQPDRGSVSILAQRHLMRGAQIQHASSRPGVLARAK